jgi:hypothetical protein
LHVPLLWFLPLNRFIKFTILGWLASLLVDELLYQKSVSLLREPKMSHRVLKPVMVLVGDEKERGLPDAYEFIDLL